MDAGTPVGWPDQLTEVFQRSIAVEYGSLTRSGRPVTVPVTPYFGASGRTLDISTGLTYPAKADRARGNPQVCLLFADPIGAGMGDQPVVLVQGTGAVRDADLQGNLDRYVQLAEVKYPETTRGVPKVALARMAYYYARIWVEVTPLRVRWWPDRQLTSPPMEWVAPPDTPQAVSDPSPTGPPPPAWRQAPADWRPLVRSALDRLPLSDLTTVGPDGYPVCLPVQAGPLDGDRIPLGLGSGCPDLVPGPACLTLHTHGTTFNGQENRTVVGQLVEEAGASRFVIERALGDWSLPGNKLQMMVAFLGTAPKLAPRLKAEAARRGQAVPKMRRC